MDSHLGQLGASRAEGSSVPETVDIWAVQTGAVAGGLLTKTGFDCYYSSTCGTITGSKSVTSDGTAITTFSSASSPKSYNSKILAIALGTCIPILLLVTILLPYLLLRRRGSNTIHQAINQPSSPSQMATQIAIQVIIQVIIQMIDQISSQRPIFLNIFILKSCPIHSLPC
jgi:hypothetical protein